MTTARICRLGAHYPLRSHSRDAALSAFTSDTAVDPNTLCGAVVSGPFAEEGVTDKYLDDRKVYQASESGVDYSASVICAFGAYAAMPADAFEHCDGVRSPLQGRGG